MIKIRKKVTNQNRGPINSSRFGKKHPGKLQVKKSLAIALVVLIALTFTRIMPPIFIGMAPGEYIKLDNKPYEEAEWIAAGEEPLEGRFFKTSVEIEQTVEHAVDVEVFAAGFPLSWCFVDNIWEGEFGIYAINILMVIIDYIAWFCLILLAIYAFGKVPIKKK